jgi:hypothetical protein
MAIQVSGTTVVDNSRNLENIVNADIGGRLNILDVAEGVNVDSSTSGTLTANLNSYAVVRCSSNQTANRTINLTPAMDVSNSMTCAVIMPMGGTAYYINSVQVNGTTSGVTTRWVGGAPTEGTANAYDVYSFTVIETSTSNYLVLASLAAFEA